VHAFLVLSSLLLSSTVALAQQSQHFVYTSQSNTNGDQFGFALCAAGDVDRDGHTDICVGAYADNNNTGYIELLSGSSGKVVRRISGAAAGDRFGFSVAAAGDVNGDSFPDVLVGAPGVQTTGLGYAHVVSGLWLWRGAGTQYLYTFKGAAAGDMYGFAVAGAGDVDQDGVGDLLIGARQQKVGLGYAQLISGKTGKLIRTYTGSTSGQNFGQSLANAGDINKDGVPDAAIGGGYLWRVMSGKDGKLLHEFTNLGGRVVAAAGDVNKDGYPDIIVYHANSGVPKKVYVVSGKDWTVIHTLQGGAGSPTFLSVAGAGDVNGDGYDDLLTNSGNATTYPVRIYSGKDATVLLSMNGATTFGISVSAGGDVNGDGHLDVLVGEPGTATSAGAVHVYSGSLLALATDIREVSLANAGVQTMSLAAGTQNAGKIYLLLGSLSGTTPGLMLGSLRLPLNVDAYFSLLLTAPNTPLLFPSLGQLDASGNATAKFTAVPQIPPSLVGSTFQHAYVVLSQTPFDLVSNPAPVTLEK